MCMDNGQMVPITRTKLVMLIDSVYWLTYMQISLLMKLPELFLNGLMILQMYLNPLTLLLDVDGVVRTGAVSHFYLMQSPILFCEKGSITVLNPLTVVAVTVTSSFDRLFHSFIIC